MGPMKYEDVVRIVDEETPRRKDEIYVNVVYQGRKTVMGLKFGEHKDGKVVFVASSKDEVGFDTFKKALHLKERDFAGKECWLRAEGSDVLVPLKRPYVSGRDDALILEADFREFDKNDPKVEDYVLFKSIYGNRTDAIKDLQHVLKSLDMELVGSPRDVKYDKTSKTTSQLYAKVRGTETRHFDLRNGSFFHADKDTYLRYGYKW